MAILGQFNSKNKEYATYTIGSSLYGYTESEVDYLCSGFSNEIEINKAIENSKAGATIILLPGTYSLGDSININKQIYFIGYGATIKSNRRDVPMLSISNSTIDISSKSSRIEGIVFSGDRIEENCIFINKALCEIENCTFEDFTDISSMPNAYAIIYITPSTDTKIKNNRFESNNMDEIIIGGSNDNDSNVVIYGNYIKGSSAKIGIFIKAPSLSSYIRSINISSNIISNEMTGIYATNSKHLVISNNNFFNNIYADINLQICDVVNINNNIMYDYPTAKAITLNTCNKANINGNTIYGATGDYSTPTAIELLSCSAVGITNNTLSRGNSYSRALDSATGISLDSASQNCLIVANVLANQYKIVNSSKIGTIVANNLEQ